VKLRVMMVSGTADPCLQIIVGAVRTVNADICMMIMLLGRLEQHCVKRNDLNVFFLQMEAVPSKVLC